MRTRRLTSEIILFAFALTLLVPPAGVANTTPHNLAGGGLTQNWSNTALITTSDDWSGVPSIEGYRGDALVASPGADPQTVVAFDGGSPVLDVTANQLNPNTNTTGGVAEFDIADDVVALQGSGTADAPFLIFYLNTTGRQGINVAYNVRDIDGAADNAVQQVALQYRVGNSGNFINLPGGYIADATTGPSIATLVTPVSVTLPAAADNQPLVQVRVITTDAPGSDEWVGIDDINITSSPLVVTPTLNISSVSVIEGSGGTITATFNVTLTNPAPPGGVTFDIATQNNSATTADNDYVLKSLTGQSIPATQTGPYQFDVTVNGDNNPEPNETFFVNVTNIVGATPGTTQGTGTILTDDAPPDLTINNVTQAETNAGTTFGFVVTLSAPAPPGGVTFDIATAPNTAIAGSDYVHQALTAQTIPATQTTYNFNVTVNGDTMFEANDTFFVNVTNVTGANVVDGQGLGTITNDDAQPSFSINDVAVTEGNSGTQTLTFTVTMNGTAEATATVNWATSDGTATLADLDYVTGGGPLSFVSGDATEQFTVTTNGDTNYEGDEHLNVTLSGATVATISDAQGFGVIKNDEPTSINAVDTPFPQNFNSLTPTATPSTPPGWTFLESGTAANLIYTPGTGSSGTGDTYNFGIAPADPDRAFGGLQSGALIPTIGALFRNDTGTTITALAVQYFGEQWRIGNNGAARDDRLDFQYSLDATSLTTGTWIDVDALDFFNPIKTAGAAGPLDGNAPANRQQRIFNISGLSIPNGATFWIRFNDFNASGADDGLAVDDFVITANFAGALLSVTDVALFEGNAGPTIFTFTVNLSAPAPGPGGVTFDIATQDGSATVADSDYVALNLTGENIAAGSTSKSYNITVNGDVTPEATQQFFVNVTNVINALPSDPQGTGTIIDDDTPLTLISAIQGSGTSSPMVGNSVTIRGIVTGVKSNGFFVQEELADDDGNSNTSEGIFVFTSGTPPAAVVLGAQAQVSGTVAEFVPSGDPFQPPLTELTSPTVVVISTGNTLPAPVVLSPSLPDPAGAFDQLERLEGMRVSAASITVVGPSDGSFTETTNNGTSNGRFHGVITGVARPFREAGIQPPDGVPSGTIPPIPRWDGNPERLRIESAALGAPLLTVKASDVVGPMQGPLDYGFRGYAILPDGTQTTIVTPGTLPTAVTAPTANEFTVASFNLQRFFDNVDDPNGDPLVNTSAYNDRVAKASIAIRNHLRNPDIIGVQEAEKIEVLQALAAKILADGGPDYDAYLVEGNDVGGIDVGFLVKTDLVPGGVPRVAVTAVTQIGKTTTWIDPDDNQPALLNDRPPLVLEGAVNRDSGSSFPIVVVVAHQRSFLGIESNAPDGLTTEGDRVRKKRQAQAEYLANYIQGRQTTNPAERLVLVGDFNAYEFNDGYVHPMGVVAGTPVPDNETVVPGDGVDLVNPDLINLVNTPPAPERYSYVHEGNAQNIDHALINAALNAAVPARRIEHPRIDADYPETERMNNATALRVSDHDPVVAFFSFPSSGALEFSAANYNVGEATTTFNVTVNRTGGTFGAVSATYTIAAGTAQGADFTAGTGTVNFVDGQTSATFPVTITNDAIDEPDQTIALTLSAPTGGATLGAQTSATITIQDDDAPPVFTISDNSVAEGNSGSSNATLDVTLTGATEFTVTVNWATADDSATTVNNDYTTSGAMLTFNGPGTQQISVPIVGDTTDEPNERLFVNLSGATNATIGDAQGEITIIDDDGVPQIFVNDFSVTEGNSGTQDVTFTITLAGTSSQTVSVDWALAAGTATCCGVDWSGGSGTVQFLVGGPSTQTVTVTIVGDTTYEPNETVLINLTNAVNAQISDPQGVLTILNDDSAPVSSYTATKAASSSTGAFVPGATVTYTVVLTNNAPFTMANNPGDEFTDVLPAGLSLVSANATSGTAVANTGTNTVTWNGSLASGGSVTISITAILTAASGTITNQGNVQADLNNDGTNETTIPTDDPNVAGQQATTFTISSSSQFTATKSVVVTGSGAGVTYTIVLANNMPHAQPDNPGDEFVDVLPPQLTLTGVSVTSGTLTPNVLTNTVTWNGSIPAGGSVTITINAAIKSRTGGPISNQGTAFIDVDNNGSNEGSVPTDDPSTPGSQGDATVIAAGAAQIPTLSSMMLMLLALLLGAIAVMKMR